MIKFIKLYYRMKMQEWQMKLTFCSVFNTFASNNKDIMKVAFNLFTAFKDTPIDELQDKVIETIAEIIHESGKADE